MKKLIFLSMMLLICGMGTAQIAGVDFSQARIVKNDADLEYEILVRLDGQYAIMYDHTPVGLKHCMDKMYSIMSLNDFDDTNYSVKDVLLADYIESITDYSGLSTSLRVGSSEIRLGWDRNDYRVVLSLKQNLIAILFIKLQ